MENETCEDCLECKARAGDAAAIARMDQLRTAEDDLRRRFEPAFERSQALYSSLSKGDLVIGEIAFRIIAVLTPEEIRAFGERCIMNRCVGHAEANLD